MSNAKPKRTKLENINSLLALEDYIIVEGHNPEEVSEGGIVIPDKAQKDAFQGTVVAVGPGKRDNNGKWLPIGIEPGDVVFIRNFLGWKVVEIGGKTYYAISSEERFAKIPKAKVVYE